MMHQYRITKYDPSNRDSDGFYTVDEWTECSDIGTAFEGSVLTEAVYLDLLREMGGDAERVVDKMPLNYSPGKTEVVITLRGRGKDEVSRNLDKVKTTGIPASRHISRPSREGPGS